MSPRKTWLDGRVDVFMDETRRLKLTCPRGPIGEEIQARVNAVALTLRVSEATARREFDDEMIREMARTMAAVVADEAPGSDPLTMTPTHVISTALAGRTIAGLAIVTQLAMTADLPCLDEDTAEKVRQPIAMTVSWGILIERSTSVRPGVVGVPEAFLRRTIRELGKGIYHLDQGGVPTDGGDPMVLKNALADNVNKLEAEL